VREEWVFRLMLDLAPWHLTSGVVEALGSFNRLEAIPHLIHALAEDDCRTIAEAALQRLGAAAVSGLTQAALRRMPSPKSESETSLRQRRSALRVLGQGPLSLPQWRSIRSLLTDEDPRVAVLACGLCPSYADRDDKAAAVRRLNQLLPNADWLLTMDIRHRLEDLRGEDET
jgi:hypothetical protein